MPGPRAVTATMALVVATRVLGISLVLAVFTPYGLGLTASHALVGLALGAYGLSMAVLQVPMGRLSDRLGRKPVLLFGLAVSAAGFVLGWWAPTIGWLIAARLLQGAGAVSGVAMALVADAAGHATRTTAMAVVGAGVGLAFMLGLVAGPLLEPELGVPGLFLLAAALTLATMLLVLALIPARRPAARAPGGLLRILRHREGLAVNAGAFAMAFALAAVLYALPLEAPRFVEGRAYGIALGGMLVVGGAGMFAAARLADGGRMGAVLAAAALLVAATPLAWLEARGLAAWLAAGALFFVGHSSLAATLPSLSARLFGPGERGAALGAYNLTQYLGHFAGAAAAGLLYGEGVLLGGAALAVGVAAASLLVRLPPRPEPRGPAQGF